MKVSVIMGIYNCAETLDSALDCIVNQSYTDWELIMCDDNSEDNTIAVAKKYVKLYPDKFILLKNDKNEGLNYTLNKCLKQAKGEYIARMDGDDLCVKERFQKEVAILDRYPEISIVSSDMIFFDDEGIWGQTHVKEKPVKKNFLKSTPFCHAACMVRREAYEDVDGYSISKKLLRVEDYHLWIKMYEKGHKGINICQPLYLMRDDRKAQRRRKLRYRFNEAFVKAYAIKALKLKRYNYIWCFVPIIKGIIPGAVYRYFHRNR